MVQVGKMLKPDKWQATFNSDGRVFGFHKALKLIVLGVCYHSFVTFLNFHLCGVIGFH